MLCTSCQSQPAAPTTTNISCRFWTSQRVASDLHSIISLFCDLCPTCLGLHVCQFAGLLCWLAQEIGSHLQHSSCLGVHCSSLYFLHPGAHVLLDEVLQLRRAQAGREYCQLLQSDFRPPSSSLLRERQLWCPPPCAAVPDLTVPRRAKHCSPVDMCCCFGRPKHK